MRRLRGGNGQRLGNREQWGADSELRETRNLEGKTNHSEATAASHSTPIVWPTGSGIAGKRPASSGKASKTVVGSPNCAQQVATELDNGYKDGLYRRPTRRATHLVAAQISAAPICAIVIVTEAARARRTDWNEEYISGCGIDSELW